MQLFSSWTGTDFLLFYIMLLGLGSVAAWWIPVQLRGQGQRSKSPDAEDVALLVGGRSSHADSVIADLFARGGLAYEGKNTLRVAEPGLPASPAGRALLAARASFTRSEADSMLAIHASRSAARLRREGLMLRSEDLTRLRWLSIAPFAALFLLALYRQRAGAALGEPTGLLVLLLGLTAALAVIRFIKFDQRTKAGIAAVERLREGNPRLKQAPLPGEAGIAVALFGTSVLVGTPWEPVHAMRYPASSSSGDGSSSDGGGDGGGGGCGGCGGCGG